jgi:2-phospho-L-lactate guanylyltransferase
VSTVAVLPIKRFAHAKQRLDLDDRAAVMREMAEGVLAALAASTVEVTLVVTGDPDARALAVEHGAEVVEEGELRGHSAAAALGVAEALRRGAGRALLVAGDCPLLTAAELDGLLVDHGGDGAAPGVVVLADRHGTGTNGLLLTPPDAIVPAFGPGSCERHASLAAAAGVPCVVDQRVAFAVDVDTVDDLAAVERAR